jgi:hypothetical protein
VKNCAMSEDVADVDFAEHEVSMKKLSVDDLTALC